MGDWKAVTAATAMLVAWSLVCFTPPASSQQPDTTTQAESLKTLSIEQLLNVEVTSVSRRPDPLARAPSAIQVITQQDIRRSGASSLPEALRLATNLEVAQVDSRQWAISARGLNSTTANKLLVLIDGRTVYTPLFSGVFWDVQDVPLEDIDRIEVISGPGATLWGANAVNGVINVITRRAADTQGTLLVAGAGNLERGAAARQGGKLGADGAFRVYGKVSDRDRTLRADGTSAHDSWDSGQAGFRADWGTAAGAFTLQGDAYHGTIDQAAAAAIRISGGNLVTRWARQFAGGDRVPSGRRPGWTGSCLSPGSRLSSSQAAPISARRSRRSSSSATGRSRRREPRTPSRCFTASTITCAAWSPGRRERW